MTAALQAIVFDFDGVIADSEPLHLRAFQQAMGDIGLELDRDDYFARYLGYDDVGVFEALSRDRTLGWTTSRVSELVDLKGRKLQALMHGGEVLFPGAIDFIRTAAEAVPIAIASGALRHEILEVLEGAGIAGLFSTIVSSGDTPESKPSPAPYRLAYERLAEASGPIDPQRCVAIEDSAWGIQSAVGAGLRCVGVTNSYPADQLTGADLIVNGLQGLSLAALDRLCTARGEPRR
jgi:beta-phosphoglucomutase